MRLPLVPSDNPTLRTKAAAVSNSARVADLAGDLLETMVAEGGVGLAAPQVGKSVRLFVVGAGEEPRVMVNPEITKRSKEEIWWEEGCLSLPRLLGEVRRPKEIKVRYQDLAGKKHDLAAEGLLARAIQHEVDHLDGVLFPDRMDDLKKLRTITEEEWQSRFEGKRPDFMDEEM